MSQSTVTVTVAPLEAVRLTAPVDGATYAPGTVIPLQAVAPPGSTVEFLCNGTVVGARTAPYTMLVTLSAGVKVFDVRLKAAVVPPPVIVPPTPTSGSPDDTYGPTVTDAAGAVWTLGTGGETRRDGVSVGGERAVGYLWLGGVAFYLNSIAQWFRWAGAAWVPFSDAEIALTAKPWLYRSHSQKGVPPRHVGVSSELANLPLIQSAPGAGVQSLVYLGSIRPPRGVLGAQISRFGYGCSAMSYNVDNDSLIMAGHGSIDPLAASEISIPTPVNTSTLASVPFGTQLQDFADPMDGLWSAIYATSEYAKYGATLPWNGRLISAVYHFYQNGPTWLTVSHFATSTLNFSTGVGSGPFAVGSPTIPGHTGATAAFTNGYMTPIPAAWQAALGGKALTGNAGLSIIERTSSGPCAYAFDPDDVGVTEPVPATMLIGYPSENPSLGGWGGPTPTQHRQGPNGLYNGTATFRGCAFPEGTRSVLFFGIIGTGDFCYGTSCATEGSPLFPNADQSPNAPPYQYMVWAVDALDLVQVKLGNINPWAVTPYAYWPITFPIAEENPPGDIGGNGRIGIRGVAYKPSSQQIFISQSRLEDPVIHVLHVE